MARELRIAIITCQLFSRNVSNMGTKSRYSISTEFILVCEDI